MAITPAFQAGDEGSIPFFCSWIDSERISWKKTESLRRKLVSSLICNIAMGNLETSSRLNAEQAMMKNTNEYVKMSMKSSTAFWVRIMKP